MNPWMSAAQLPSHRIRCCFYGDTRSGKTHIAATFPRPVFIFPKNEGSEEVIRGNDFGMAKVNSRAEMEARLQDLLAAQNSGRIREWGDTVVIESLSHYSELFTMELTDHGRQDMKGHWGTYSAHFTYMREVLWQLDMHVVITGLANVKTDKNGSIIKAGFKLFGQPGDLIVSSCDLVGFCEQIPGPRWLCHVENYGKFPGGTRVRGMPNGCYENFNFAEHIAPYLQQPVQQQPAVGQ